MDVNLKLTRLKVKEQPLKIPESLHGNALYVVTIDL